MSAIQRNNQKKMTTTTTKQLVIKGVDGSTKTGSRWQRFVTLRNNKKAIISSSEGTTKTIDDDTDNDDNDANDEKAFIPPKKKQTLCAKERWNRFQVATKKKMKESAKEMEMLHRTQPHYYVGAFGVVATPPSFNPQGYCY